MPSRRREDVVTGTISVTAGPTLGATLVTAQLGSRTADAVIEVVEPEAEPAPTPPTDLEFERARYRLVVGKAKPVRVRAPLEAYDAGTTIRVTSNNRFIVVLDGGRATLQPRPGMLCMEGTVRVEGRREREAGALVAADPGGRSARAEAEVVRKEESGNEFRTELVPDVQGDQRAQWTSDYSVLRIMGEHLGVRPYLGSKEENYPGQDSPQFRMLTAELVSDAVVRRILLEKYGEDEIDAGTLYVQQYRLLSRLLARAHKIVATSA